MRTVYKYPLNGIGTCVISLPKGAKVLSASLQYATFVIWAEVFTDPRDYPPVRIKGTSLRKNEVPTENRTFLVVPTGGDDLERHKLSKPSFLGTVIEPCIGGTVWHIFEIL